jgi:menaquinone-dependent protoporphyrinogen oxidase
MYGTRWGGTVGVAEKISETLREEGYAVDVVDAKMNPPGIDPYDLVIVGSSISANKWVREAEGFLKANASGLGAKKTALFVSCGAVQKEREEDREKDRENYLPKVAKRYGLEPVGYGFFGGVVNFEAKYNLLDRFIVNSSKTKLRKMGIDTTKPYDFRDWEQIEAWTREIAQTLPAPIAITVGISR